MVIIAFLVPVIAPFPFLLLELFVGFIQALVFSMLTTVFLSIAIAKHH
jgi:F-type H+-transporting ATPase subunit a